MNKKWNPRYVAYAKTHGKTPEDMLIHDKARWHMSGFMAWMAARLQEWRTAHGLERFEPLSQEDDIKFSQWLSNETHEQLGWEA